MQRDEKKPGYVKSSSWSTTKWLFASHVTVNALKPEQNGRYFAYDIGKYIFLRESVFILIIFMKFVPKFPINHKTSRWHADFWSHW